MSSLNIGISSDAPLRLVSTGEIAPNNLAEVLRELGAGDHRFMGTSFGRGECDLATFLQECRDSAEGRNLPAGWVPQTMCWLVGPSGQVVGIVRVRHRLSPFLLQYGGHIGYYVSPAQRGKGYGRAALRLALKKLRELGVDRALLTVNPQNPLSRRVILANGGVADAPGAHPESGEVVERYWIEL